MATWRGSKADFLRNLHLLPAVLAGHRPDPHGLAKIFLTHLGNAALTCLLEDFRTKAAGGTGRDGVSWPALSESTVKQKLQKGVTHGQTLRDTDTLETSLTPDPTNEPDAARIFGQLFRMEPGNITVGVDESQIPYAKWHQEGTATMPARKIVPEGGEMPAGWTAEMDAAAEEAMKKVVEVMCAAGGVG